MKQNKLEKEDLRNHIRALKKENFSGNDFDYYHLSKLMTDRLLSSKLYTNAKKIAIFASKQQSQEIHTDDIISHALKSNKEIYLPRCIVENKELEFLRIKNLNTDTESGAYNIREPKKALIIPNQHELLSEVDVIFIPGMAFCAKNGKRLGYGAGYYDRFIEKLHEINPNLPKVGLAFDFQVFESYIPNKDHDSRVDFIFTPSKSIQIHHSK